MTSTNPETKPARVLVVDDEPTLLRALETLLRKKGHEVTAIESPIAATQKLAQEDFDVALLDIKMPHLSGLELLHAVKHRRPEIEVIMMTGHATVETAHGAIGHVGSRRRVSVRLRARRPSARGSPRRSR